MKTLVSRLAATLSLMLCFAIAGAAQTAGNKATAAPTAIAATKAAPSAAAGAVPVKQAPDTSAAQAAQASSDTAALDMPQADGAADDTGDIEAVEAPGFHQMLKTKFIEGNASFMSLVALALVIGLAFCIERIIYLTLSEIDTDRFMRDLDGKIADGDLEGAKTLCRDTRGPVASICYQGLVRAGESIDNIERSVASYGSVQAARLEKGCSWITLFIAMAPSLGFLGTVIGMVMAFDQIQTVGDINPTVVAAGMKVALITTIFGIIVALVLQLFYNYILSKIDRLTAQMEECAISLLDALVRLKARDGKA